MKDKILKVAYDKGLYAQGTPDSWDEEALYQFGKYIIDECINAIESVRGVAYTTHDNDMVMTTKAVAIENIHKKFQ